MRAWIAWCTVWRARVSIRNDTGFDLSRSRVGWSDERMSVVIVAAHPDDEVIGAGGWMRMLSEQEGADVRVVHVTDGAPRDMRDAHAAGFTSRAAYGHERRREAGMALRLAGVPATNCVRLGFVDQEVSFNLVALTRRIAALLAEQETIDRIVTHPYEGGHPDHDATAFAVHAAVGLLRRRDRDARAPQVCEMTSYHAGSTGMQTGVFLPPHAAELTLTLSPAAQEGKAEMLRCFETQRQMLEHFAELRCERFRPAPSYRFDLPPHGGRLWYEHFNWGVDGMRWRQLAAEALAQLETTCR
jgi:N-acetylglucosamine malate deacetylase 2